MVERYLDALLVHDDAADEDHEHHDRKHYEGTIHGYSFRPGPLRNEVGHHSTLPKSETERHRPRNKVVKPDTTGSDAEQQLVPTDLGEPISATNLIRRKRTVN